MTTFKNRVYGCAIIKSNNANYNADFTKQPRTLPNGLVYASDKALKYTVRHFIYKNYSQNLNSESNSTDKLLYFTRNKTTTDNQFVPMSLKETYEYLFGPIEMSNKTGNKTPKWMFYFYDGENISGALQVVKANKIKTIYKDNEPDFLNALLDASKNSTDRKIINGTIEIEKEKILSINEDDSFYFYINNEGEYKRIDVEPELLEPIIQEINLFEFGNYDKIKILYNLLNCIDVRLFGATYTGDTNVSIHGPVQINTGVDKFLYNGVIQNLSYTEQIKSPVRNDKAKGGQAEMTTIGSSSKTMEAHYVHNFSINPKNLDDHLSIANKLNDSEEDKYPKKDGLSTDDIEKLQNGLRCGATLYDSTSKAGVENEMLIWIELNDDSKQVIPNLTELITVYKGEDGQTVINLKKVKELLLDQKHIEAEIKEIKIFYNNIYTKPSDIKEEGKIKFLPIELSDNKEKSNE